MTNSPVNPGKRASHMSQPKTEIAQITLKEGQSLQKRDEILLGANKVFMKAGFSGASMEDIARTSGVSKGTLYNYFRNKEDLFTALIKEECAKVSSDVFALEDTSGTPEEVLTQIGVGFVYSILRSDAMSMYRTVLAESHKFPELGRIFYNSGPAPGSLLLGTYLRRLVNDGIIDITDEVLAAYQFISLCEVGVSERAHLQVASPTDEEILNNVKSAVGLFLRGYSKRRD